MKEQPELLKKVLIANRGEIALRVIRACNELGVQTVLVHSEADADSLPVSLADESYCIGPVSPAKSYLNTQAIMNVALLANVDGIHPGYGFLSENAHFARMCREHRIKFIGASPEVIEQMGDKATARDTVEKAGVPTVPGSDGLINSIEEAKQVAGEIGYPVLIKATAGGGGRGMRLVHDESGLEKAINSASQEAENAFGNAGVYLEKFITRMRHIEIQIFSDVDGNHVYLGERDCTIQRRHQKLIEEALSPYLDKKLRKEMGEAAVKIAKAVDYEGAGTVEFILDADTKKFYFMEMNTRIQVEHTITEMVTGLDLVKEQIKVASMQSLSFKQEDVEFKGHCIEFRINAEDPANNFVPSPGLIKSFIIPGGMGVRTDTHCYAGYTIPPYYDSLMGKLIVHAEDREQAIIKSRRALEEFGIEGVKTTIPLFLEILDDEKFITSDFTTHYLDTFDFDKLKHID